MRKKCCASSSSDLLRGQSFCKTLSIAHYPRNKRYSTRSIVFFYNAIPSFNHTLYIIFFKNAIPSFENTLSITVHSKRYPQFQIYAVNQKNFGYATNHIFRKLKKSAVRHFFVVRCQSFFIYAVNLLTECRTALGFCTVSIISYGLKVLFFAVIRLRSQIQILSAYFYY